MSYYDDYVAEGLCCECCGAYLDGTEPGFSRLCDGCRAPVKQPKPARKSRQNPHD
jgi:hypothetical protein